jgi:hypothetical protein
VTYKPWTIKLVEKYAGKVMLTKDVCKSVCKKVIAKDSWIKSSLVVHRVYTVN